MISSYYSSLVVNVVDSFFEETNAAYHGTGNIRSITLCKTSGESSSLNLTPSATWEEI
ncbi:MAG: hypothetical protein KGJ59_03625 [Bacteroidota bacterium]|nr:hypothetical protein [Bacteroidota bacterium]